MLDVARRPLALGYAIGRIGCQLAGDGDYGKDWNGPWAMAYPHGTVPTTDAGPSDADLRDARHGPRRAACCGGCATASAPARCSRLWLLLAGTERFLVEFVRRNPAELFGLTQPQLISVVMVVGGTAFLVWLRRGATVQDTTASSSSSRTRRASSAGV